jgi:hypothetical protein
MEEVAVEVRAVVLGPHGLQVFGMDDAQPQFLVRAPLFLRIAGK